MNALKKRKNIGTLQLNGRTERILMVFFYFFCMDGRIYQINVKPETPGERGLPKQGVWQAMVNVFGIVGDFNRYRAEKNGNDRDTALLVLPFETIQELQYEGWPVAPGDLGENITMTGIAYDHFRPGGKYRLGSIEMQIARACDPCTNLYCLPYVGRDKGPRFMRTLLGRRGWYARVLKEGYITQGDLIEERVHSKE